jgi:hypothetical protein
MVKIGPHISEEHVTPKFKASQMLFSFLTYSLTLKMETLYSSETSRPLMYKASQPRRLYSSESPLQKLRIQHCIGWQLGKNTFVFLG